MTETPQERYNRLLKAYHQQPTMLMSTAQWDPSEYEAAKRKLREAPEPPRTPFKLDDNNPMYQVPDDMREPDSSWASIIIAVVGLALIGAAVYFF